MTMKLGRVVFFLTLALGLIPQAKASIDLVGAATSMMPSGDTTATGNFSAPGAGVILNFRLTHKVDFSLGAVYLSRSYTSNVEHIQKVVNGRSGFGFHLNRYFTLNLGAYYNHSLDDPSLYAGKDYGALAGLAMRLPMSHNISFLVQPEYHYALKTVAYDSASFKPSEMAFLVGFSIVR